MLTMSQINHIKDLSNCGYRISEISEKPVRILKPYGNIWRRRIFHHHHLLFRKNLLNWILSNRSSRNGWMRIKSIGGSSTTLPSGFLTVWWQNLGLPEATVSFSAI